MKTKATKELKDIDYQVSHGKPQRRTLVKALRKLVDSVNGSVFNALDEEEIKHSYMSLLRVVNEAERILDRERQHSRAKKDEAS